MQAVTLNNGVEMPILGFGVFGSLSPQNTTAYARSRERDRQKARCYSHAKAPRKSLRSTRLMINGEH
jgi:hypothetical protein